MHSLPFYSPCQSYQDRWIIMPETESQPQNRLSSPNANISRFCKESPNTQSELDRILHPWVKKWFQSKFKSYSLPQLFGVMEIHSRKNTLISAPTGATKTLTAFLSILNELVDSADKGILKDKIYCVYISPLKALNEDIKVNLINQL